MIFSCIKKYNNSIITSTFQSVFLYLFCISLFNIRQANCMRSRDKISQRTPAAFEMWTTKGWSSEQDRRERGLKEEESLISLLLFMMQKEARARESVFFTWSSVLRAHAASIYPSIHPHVWEDRGSHPELPPCCTKEVHYATYAYTSPRPSQNTRHLTLSYYGFAPLYVPQQQQERRRCLGEKLPPEASLCAHWALLRSLALTAGSIICSALWKWDVNILQSACNTECTFENQPK